MKPYIFYSIIGLTILLSSCKNDDESFGNAVYFNSPTTAKVTEVLVKGAEDAAQSAAISAGIPKPQKGIVILHYMADFSLVDQYNRMYDNQAIALPSENYELPDLKVEIAAGNVRSSETVVRFKSLNELDREIAYVLPITIADANIPILGSARTHYFVIKGAALINVIADIQENYLSVKWANPDVVNNLSQLTMEALVRARSFDGEEAGINTIMGIEGQFLLRIGDGGGYPKNQVQLATSRGNFPPNDPSKGLPMNEWIHIAVTYNSDDGTVMIYVNGEKQSEGIINDVGRVDLGTNDFFIGKSFSDNRYFRGEITECRIWNVVRTPEEIASNRYSVDSKAEGLAAYWKFDEGSGKTVKDYANGNNAEANKSLKWTGVSLPPAVKKEE